MTPNNPLTPERETTGNSEWTDTHADRFVASLRQEAAEYRLRHPQGESCQAEYALQLIDRLRASTVPIKTVAEIVGQIHTHIETPDDAAEAIRRLRASNEALREDLRTEVRNAAWESEQRQKAQEERDALRADHEATKRQLEISRNQTKDAFERVAREYNEKIAIRAAQSLPPGMTQERLAEKIFYRVRDWTRDDEKHYEPSGVSKEIIAEIAAWLRSQPSAVPMEGVETFPCHKCKQPMKLHKARPGAPGGYICPAAPTVKDSLSVQTPGTPEGMRVVRVWRVTPEKYVAVVPEMWGCELAPLEAQKEEK